MWGKPQRAQSALKLIVREAAELPVVRLIAEPIYRRAFRRPYWNGNAYYGVFDSYQQAQAVVPQWLPSTYDVTAAGRMYSERLDQIRVSDYPVIYWLSQLLQEGQRRVFDLGGHIGISYYGFRRHIPYPDDLRWLVHDVPEVISAGRSKALELDPHGRLAFTQSRHDASGHDILISSGALQYLDYTLPELLQSLPTPPRHVLVNLTPLHPSRSYFTLQNIGVAICPYRVTAIPEFVNAIAALGYAVVDRWESRERALRIPFTDGLAVDCYSGFYFRLESDMPTSQRQGDQLSSTLQASGNPPIG